MFYNFVITVPANTLRSDPLVEELKLTEGVLQKVSILFPDGCHGMVRIQLLYQEHQYLPTNPDGYFASDNEALNIDDYFLLNTEPYNLKVIASSEGCDFSHTIHLRVGVLRPDEVEQQSPIITGLKKMLQLIGIRI